MPATYTDQVQKLDIRSMMGAAFKACPGDRYTVCCNAPGWRAFAEGQATLPDQRIIARIQLNRVPAKGALQPWYGLSTLSVTQVDGRSCEQTLWLNAALTRSRRWQWSTLCP